MNKEKGKAGHSKFMRDLALTIIGTTISIILTFGTAHVITEQQKRTDGRQTAMMVIHDIEEYVQLFSDLAKSETDQYNTTYSVMGKLDSLESIPLDTLMKVAYYISSDETERYRIDDNIEHTFQSSQETWKNINTPRFIDEARDYYYQRRYVISIMNQSSLFLPPVPYEELVRIASQTWDKDFTGNMILFLREKLNSDDVKYFLARYHDRIEHLTVQRDNWKNQSERCKFLMGITDDELQQYMEHRRRNGSPLKDRQLVGSWTTVEDEPQHFVFLRDHTFTQTVSKSYPSRLYSGTIKMNQSVKGRWKVKGDTLFRYYDQGRTVELDASGIHYSAEMKDSVERSIDRYRAYFDNEAEAQKQWTHDDIVRAAAIDRTGRKIELSWEDEDGNQNTGYFVKEK